ncbi:MAG: hypothetical protein IM581_04325 [Chitinophagaceae bacterium]|nr:hypothetical protein [Chitinophagaceae bacterium]
MSIFETYSQSQKNKHDSFEYNSIPKELCIQIVHVWEEFFNQETVLPDYRDKIFNEISKILMREHSLLELPSSFYHKGVFDKTLKYFLSLEQTALILDVIQVICLHVKHLEEVLKRFGYISELHIKADEVIDEINNRFKLKGIGYQYSNGKIIRLDNELLHDETIQKTISLINNETYNNVNNEFMTALDHLRFKRNADCLVWCLKCYESIIKIIAKKNKWKFEENATSGVLTKLLFDNGFFDSFMNQPLDNLRALLGNSINNIRNKKGGHGAGEQINEVPNGLAKSVLYVTGATLQLIFDTQKEYEKKKR